MDNGTLAIENASSVMLLTRIEWFAEYSEQKVEALRAAVEALAPDYPALVERHRKVQSEALNRVTVDFGGASQYGMSTEELLSDQRSRDGHSPALLQKIFEMGRYWFILTSGKYCSMSAEVNANINLQISPGPQGDLREGMDAYFTWMESLARTSASTRRTSSACAARTIPSGRTKASASRSIIPAPHRPGRCGRIPSGFPPEAGVSARSGITIWSRGTWNSSASAWCRPIKIWRCSTRIS